MKTTVVDYITAGVDTIGNSVLFTIALLALPENQACQVRLRTELETYADGEGNFPSDTIDKLVYLKVGHLVQKRGIKDTSITNSVFQIVSGLHPGEFPSLPHRFTIGTDPRKRLEGWA